MATGHVALVALWHHSGPRLLYFLSPWLHGIHGWQSLFRHRIQTRWCSLRFCCFEETLSRNDLWYLFKLSGLGSKVPRKAHPQQWKLPGSYVPSSKEDCTQTTYKSQGGSGRRHWVKSATVHGVCCSLPRDRRTEHGHNHSTYRATQSLCTRVSIHVRQVSQWRVDMTIS